MQQTDDEYHHVDTRPLSHHDLQQHANTNKVDSNQIWHGLIQKFYDSMTEVYWIENQPLFCSLDPSRVTPTPTAQGPG